MRNALINILLPLSILWADGLKSPSAFLGYDLGDHFTYHHRVVSYYEHVAENTSNVKIIPYGETYEQRPLIVAVISSDKNMAMLDDLRKDNLKRAGMLKGKASKKKVGIVWLS